MKTLLSVVLTIALIISLAINTLLLWWRQVDVDKNDQQIKNLSEQIALQKQNKNKIYQLGEKQADTNDKLVVQQTQVLEKIEAYIAEVERTVRFVNGQAQVLPTANQNSLEVTKVDLYKEIDKLKELMDENAQRKEEFKNETDLIYRSTNEDKPNRANPREGIR